MIELKQHRGIHHKLFDNGDSTRTLKSSNNLHYANLDLVGDGADDRLRTVDKNLIWTGSKWVYDYAEERVVIPKTLDTNNLFSFKQAGSQSELVFEGINAVGVRTDSGMYGYDQVEYPDTPVAGVSMILTPSRIGLVKLYKIPTSMLPLDLSIPVAGNTEFISLAGKVWDSTRINSLPVTVSVETIAGQKYIKKEIPVFDTDEAYVYTDALISVNAATYTTGAFWGYSTGGTWAAARDALTSPIIAGPEFGGQVRNNAGLYSVGRGAISFDTSGVAGGIVTAATITMLQYNAQQAQGVYLLEGLFASPTAILTTEFDHVNFFGRSGIAMDVTDVLSPAIGGSVGTKVAALTDVSTISTSGYTKFGVAHVRDVDNTGPGVSSITYAALFEGHDHVSAPSLDVTFTPAVAPTGLPSDGTMFRSAIGGGQKLLMNAGYLNNGLTRR